MPNTVGVPTQIVPGMLQQLSLFFDKVAIVELEERVRLLHGSGSILKVPEHTELARELEFLQDRGVVFEPRIPTSDLILEDQADIQRMGEGLESLTRLRSARERVSAALRQPMEELHDAIVDFVQIQGNWHKLAARIVAAQMRKQDGLIAYPVLDTVTHPSAKELGQTRVAEIILRKFPIPAHGVPWEAILDFRNDDTTRGLLLRLRVWANEIARGELSSGEIDEQIEWLLFEYERQLKLHRMAYSYGTIGTLFVAGAELLENLLRLRLSKVAKTLVELRNHKTSLLKSESDLLGSPIAYIARVRSQFMDCA